jgi:hypothetical protein
MKLVRVLCLATLAGAACAPPSPSPIRLNEIMPANNDNCRDEAGEHDDWIELYNPTDAPVDLGGCSLTDDTSLPRRSVIPDGLIIQAKSTLLFWADGTPAQGKDHLSFRLSRAEEEVVFYDAQARQVDLFHWLNATANYSFARFPDGTGAWQTCRNPTCGESNGTSCGTGS